MTANPTPSDWCILCHSETLWRKDCEQCADVLDLALVKLGGRPHEEKGRIKMMAACWRGEKRPGWHPPSDNYFTVEKGSLGIDWDVALSSAMGILGDEAPGTLKLDRTDPEVRNAMNEMPRYCFA